MGTVVRLSDRYFRQQKQRTTTAQLRAEQQRIADIRDARKLNDQIDNDFVWYFDIAMQEKPLLAPAGIAGEQAERMKEIW